MTRRTIAVCVFGSVKGRSLFTDKRMVDGGEGNTALFSALVAVEMVGIVIDWTERTHLEFHAVLVFVEDDSQLASDQEV